jgi:hypothetical protein
MLSTMLDVEVSARLRWIDSTDIIEVEIFGSVDAESPEPEAFGPGRPWGCEDGELVAGCAGAI